MDEYLSSPPQAYKVGCDAGIQFQDAHKSVSVFRYTI